MSSQYCLFYEKYALDFADQYLKWLQITYILFVNTENRMSLRVQGIAQWEFARPVLKNLKLKLEVRWVLQNWGKTEAFRCFLRKWKSVKNWLRYKQFSDFPNSKIFAGMLKKLAAQLSHCAVPSTRRDMRFSVFTNNI